MLEAPPHLLAGERLVAELAHRGANRLGSVHCVDDPTVVQGLAHGLAPARALVLVVEDFEDVRVDPELRSRGVEGRALVALGTVASGDHVGVVRRPPVADEVIHLESLGGGLLDGDLVHHAPAGHEDPVRIDAADLQPRRPLFLPRVIDGEQRQLELVLLRQLVERRVGLLAVGAVVVDVDDLLPLELVEPALLVADVPDHGRGLAPVVGGEVEHPREPPAVGRGAHAVAHRQNRHLVHRRLRDELIGDARAVGVHDQRTGRTLALELLVTLDAQVGLVLRLALLPGELDTVDAAVALVEEREIVDEPVGDRDAAGRVGAGPVDEQRDEVLPRRKGGCHRRAHDRRREQHAHESSPVHPRPPSG